MQTLISTTVILLSICVVFLLTNSQTGLALVLEENSAGVNTAMADIKEEGGDDDDDDDDDERLLEIRRKRFPIGDPRGANSTLDYGRPCIKTNPRACKLYPDVQCIHVVEQKFVCRCDFLHTWDPLKQKCILNVFAPCNIAGAGKMLKCGANMECQLDSVGNSDEDRFCRCLKGFKIIQNQDQIPAFCEPDEKFVMDAEETFIQSGGVLIERFQTKAPMIIIFVFKLLAE